MKFKLNKNIINTLFEDNETIESSNSSNNENNNSLNKYQLFKKYYDKLKKNKETFSSEDLYNYISTEKGKLDSSIIDNSVNDSSIINSSINTIMDSSIIISQNDISNLENIQKNQNQAINNANKSSIDKEKFLAQLMQANQNQINQQRQQINNLPGN